MWSKKDSWRILFAVVIMLALLPAYRGYAQEANHTFPETGKTVTGRFLQYWSDHGGLAQQGYPISNVIGEISDTDGKVYTVQYFERAIFEYHPQNPSPNDVLLSLLGAFAYNGNYPYGAPNQIPNTDVGTRLFAETGKHLGGIFLQYWNAHGGLTQEGYPISEEFIETSTLDGKPYLVQYFERAVFEYHPENPVTSNVLLSQLGTFRYQQKYASSSVMLPPPIPVPAANPAVAPTPVQVTPPPPPSNQVPTDNKEFANYIINKYKIGNCTISADFVYVNTSGSHSISIFIKGDSFICVHDSVTKADAEAWGNTILADAQEAWPGEAVNLTLEYSDYTYDPCFDCGDTCYYLGDYDVDYGWYEAFTLVTVIRSKNNQESVDASCI
ncbi:MAG TPA: hypothetical protein VLQ48_05970 [Chloroflexia bacterium]|nr:hypothetical protein [Chloroflexia bacterium]